MFWILSYSEPSDCSGKPRVPASKTSVRWECTRVHALTAPLDSLESNWAYMVIASLAWSLKAWASLLIPVSPRWRETHEAEKQTLLRMDFTTFRQAMINIPAQIVRTGRRIVYRLLSWNRWQPTFFRLWNQLNKPLRC